MRLICCMRFCLPNVIYTFNAINVSEDSLRNGKGHLFLNVIISVLLISQFELLHNEDMERTKFRKNLFNQRLNNNTLIWIKYFGKPHNFLMFPISAYVLQMITHDIFQWCLIQKNKEIILYNSSETLLIHLHIQRINIEPEK